MQTDNKIIEVEKYLNEKYRYIENRDIYFHKTAAAWVDLSYLPKTKNGTVNWQDTINCIIPFTYKTLNGEFKIVDYTSKGQSLLLEYNGKILKPITTGHLKELKVKGILNDFLINIEDFYFKKGQNYADCRGLVFENSNISWINSTGMKIPFQYETVSGEFKIVDYSSKGQKLFLEYNGTKLESIKTNSLMSLSLKAALSDFLINVDDFYFKKNDNYVDCRNLVFEVLNISWIKSVGMKVPFKYRSVEGVFTIVDYSPEDQFLKLSYNNEILKNIKTTDFIKVKLGGILGLVTTSRTTEEFKLLLESAHANIEVIGEYIDANTSIYCRCKVQKCRHTWHPTPSYLLNQGSGCPACAGQTVCNSDYHNSIYYTRPDVAKNFFNFRDAFKYMQKSNRTAKFICRECLTVEEKLVCVVSEYGFSCKKCGDGVSYPEKFAYNLMDQLINNYDILNIKREFSDSWTKKRRYDLMFTYNNQDYILEMDGSFHNKNNDMSGQTVEKAQAIDMEKDLIAIGQGKIMIRIDCDYKKIQNRHEYIKNNVINSYLSQLFDLSEIDWKDIELKSVGSLQARAWKIKRENQDLTAREIGNILNLSSNTIVSYLKNGNDLGMCEYDSKKENTRLNSKGTIFVKVDGILYNKKFSSTKELCDFSLEEFGEKFPTTSIYRILNVLDYYQLSKPYKDKYTLIKTPYGTTFEELQEQLNK